jgi:hypothetical protein
LYEPANGGTFKILDNAPRSPVKNPGSRKYRFSVGDQLIFSNPVLDKKGGTRLATLYAEATVVSGKTFANVKALSRVTLVLINGDQIVAEGSSPSAARRCASPSSAAPGATPVRAASSSARTTQTTRRRTP